jgi:hydrogenase expression/formation protein HypC
MCLGIPGQIVEITDTNKKLAVVNVAGVRRQVNIACIVDENHSPADCIGDWVLVHVGFAMNRINEKEAAETLQLLQELSAAQAALSN